MASKIGNPIYLKDVEYKVNMPVYFTQIATSEKHNDLLKATVAASQMLEQVANRVIEINDPMLVELLMKLGLIIGRPKPIDGFEDI